MSERKNNRLLTILIVLLFVSQRIALHISEFEFPLAIFIWPTFLLLFCTKGNLQVNGIRLIIYFMLVCVSFIFVLISSNATSFYSYTYFLLIYFLLCFDLKLTVQNMKWIFQIVELCLLLSGLFGIIQFLVQLFGVKAVDPYSIFPSNILLSGFNTTYPVQFGGSILKSNGGIYLEPSFFSQFMALGILLELNFRKLNSKIIVKIIVFALAIITSFSGTGLLLLSVGFILYFFKFSIKNKIIFTLLFAIAVILLSSSHYSYLIYGRLAEFSSSNLSGSIRFINPFVVAFTENSNSLVFGCGSGCAERMSTSLEAAHNAITKMVIEYGFFTMILFLVFVCTVFFRKSCSIFSLCLMLMYLFLAGNLLHPEIIFLLNIIIETNFMMSRVMVSYTKSHRDEDNYNG